MSGRLEIFQEHFPILLSKGLPVLSGILLVQKETEGVQKLTWKTLARQCLCLTWVWRYFIFVWFNQSYGCRVIFAVLLYTWWVKTIWLMVPEKCGWNTIVLSLCCFNIGEWLQRKLTEFFFWALVSIKLPSVKSEPQINLHETASCVGITFVFCIRLAAY